MRVLFCVADIFLGEPHGVLQLAAIAKNIGHQVKLCSLKQKTLPDILRIWAPNVLAYSTMSPEVGLFKMADEQVRDWAADKRVLRVMGGAHATYFPEVLNEFGLDAICIGEGDHAFPELLRRFENGDCLSGIPNILACGDKLEGLQIELISKLEELPFIDRRLYYEVAPHYELLAVRGFMTGRGCPYNCSYCHNHAFNELFKHAGKIIRRRTVDHVLDEMKAVLKEAPHVRLIKISDDTFAHVIDEWLSAFLTRYKHEINLPFYCLMRSNTLTKKMAQLLKEAGCISVCMSVESGNEQVRNTLLNRGLSDKQVVESFENARQYHLHTYGNTLLALPGTKFANDLESFLFTKRLKMTVPTFGIFSPYPKTRLYEYAMAQGQLPTDFKFDHYANRESALNSFSPIEKRMQLNLAYMGTLFCDLPDFFYPFIKWLLRLPFGIIYKRIGPAYMILKLSLFIFPKTYPLNPVLIWSVLSQSVRFFSDSKEE